MRGAESVSKGLRNPEPISGYDYTENRSEGLTAASEPKSCVCGRRIYAQREWCSVCNKKIAHSIEAGEWTLESHSQCWTHPFTEYEFTVQLGVTDPDSASSEGGRS